MSAADKREELEAAIHRELTRAYRRGRTQAAETIIGPFAPERVLALADDYATEVASETLDGVVRADRQRDRRDELSAAVRGAP